MSDLELTMMRRVGELNKENAALKAEVEELKSQPDPLTAYLYADTLRRDDIKTLKAHIERLTKAGDEMDRALTTYAGNMKDNCFQCQLDWNAAKEGKGQP
jgi:predicted RNase H-like nuclease (RuvC/YqgF family)